MFILGFAVGCVLSYQSYKAMWCKGAAYGSHVTLHEILKCQIDPISLEQESEDNIIEALRWAGMDDDEIASVMAAMESGDA